VFKVTEFCVQAFAVSDGVEGCRRQAIGEPRRTRDEDEARRWAQEARDRLGRKRDAGRYEVLVYSVIGEPMFDLWDAPRVRVRFRSNSKG
jgi:hypothetical protein